MGKRVKFGDLICVLYGCSVPVILRRHEKNENELAEEEMEYHKDKVEAAVKLQRIYRHNRVRRQKADALREKKAEAENLPAGHGRSVGQLDIEPLSRAATAPQNHWKDNGDVVTRSNSLANSEKHVSKRLLPPTSATTTIRVLAEEEETERQKFMTEERRFWYEFIGECYVHGMMDGEAITRQNFDQIPAQIFELR